MSEKVYGIRGTNKCRKEVIPMENILVLLAEIPAFNNKTETVKYYSFQAEHYLSAKEIEEGGFANYVVVNLEQQWQYDDYWYIPQLPANASKHYSVTADALTYCAINDDESGDVKPKALRIRAVLMKIQ